MDFLCSVFSDGNFYPAEIIFLAFIIFYHYNVIKLLQNRIISSADSEILLFCYR